MSDELIEAIKKARVQFVQKYADYFSNMGTGGEQIEIAELRRCLREASDGLVLATALIPKTHYVFRLNCVNYDQPYGLLEVGKEYDVTVYKIWQALSPELWTNAECGIADGEGGYIRFLGGRFEMPTPERLVTQLETPKSSLDILSEAGLIGAIRKKTPKRKKK